MEINSICLKEKKKRFEEHLLGLGYSEGTIACYQRTLSRLEEFMSEHGETLYSTGVGIAFMERGRTAGQSNGSLKAKRLVIRRLEDFIKGEYSLTASRDQSVSDCYSKDFNAYIEHLRLEGKRESTVKNMYYHCSLFLEDFHKALIYNLSAIEPQDIYDVFSKSSNKINLCIALRSFLRYLFKSGTLAKDLSVFVPSVGQCYRVPYFDRLNNHLFIQKRRPVNCCQV
jgi:site-specific recombinase XerD